MRKKLDSTKSREHKLKPAFLMLDFLFAMIVFSFILISFSQFALTFNKLTNAKANKTLNALNISNALDSMLNALNSHKSFAFSNQNLSFPNNLNYSLNNNALFKNNALLATNIQNFSITKLTNNTYKIEICFLDSGVNKCENRVGFLK